MLESGFTAGVKLDLALLAQVSSLAFKNTDAAGYHALFLAKRALIEATGNYVLHINKLVAAGPDAQSIVNVDKKRGRSLVKNVRASYAKLAECHVSWREKKDHIQAELSEKLTGHGGWEGVARLMDFDLGSACGVDDHELFQECVQLHVSEFAASLKALRDSMLKDVNGLQKDGQNYWRNSVEDTATLEELLESASILKPGALKAMALSQNLMKMVEAGLLHTQIAKAC